MFSADGRNGLHLTEESLADDLLVDDGLDADARGGRCRVEPFRDAVVVEILDDSKLDRLPLSFGSSASAASRPSSHVSAGSGDGSYNSRKA
jgi:hypothetical protein